MYSTDSLSDQHELMCESHAKMHQNIFISMRGFILFLTSLSHFHPLSILTWAGNLAGDLAIIIYLFIDFFNIVHSMTLHLFCFRQHSLMVHVLWKQIMRRLLPEQVRIWVRHAFVFTWIAAQLHCKRNATPPGFSTTVRFPVPLTAVACVTLNHLRENAH